jgi:uncharacterized protein (TIGR03118 family)
LINVLQGSSGWSENDSFAGSAAKLSLAAAQGRISQKIQWRTCMNACALLSRNLLSHTLPLSVLAVMASLVTAEAAPQAVASSNRYAETRFVANHPKYKAGVIEPEFINAWGISMRPAGVGGHFWVTAKDISFEYVGDVHAASDPAFRTLHTDGLKYVKLPTGGKDNFATGTVFSGSTSSFVITQQVKGADPITAPAKFLFASDGGVISAWTERKKSDGTFDWPAEAVAVIDESDKGVQFFGLAINAAHDRLYTADFGAEPAIRVYDSTFKSLPLRFDLPFDHNGNHRVDPGEYAPFNIQTLITPAGQSHVFVAYAKTQPCPVAAVTSGSCAAGDLFAGEEETSQPGSGRLAEFTEDGKLVAIWPDAGHLSAPWGVAYAPARFGALSNALLVANFGTGTIAGYDAVTRRFIDVLRDPQGQPVVIDKLWGIVFGNGESLGDRNALYYAAGPEDEADGLFGSLRAVAAGQP